MSDERQHARFGALVRSIPEVLCDRELPYLAWPVREYMAREFERLQAALAAANATINDAAEIIRVIVTQERSITGQVEAAATEWYAAHRARVREKPLRCDNCGKTMAEHGPLANCRAHVGEAQP